MFSLLLLVMLCSSCLAAPTSIGFSYSNSVGQGSGTSYSTQGTGRITTIRVWERPRSFVASFQLCYDYICTDKIGRAAGNLQEMHLYEDETIIQVSGKHNGYIYHMVFVTSRGRFLSAGHPSGDTFNFFPTDMRAGLRILSGRYDKVGITSLGAHWGEVIFNTNRSRRR
ncbi:zymogen granule membrane protein 16-like [Notolabrus celidotus]|uniref:zymogen granule membrane protein 16-like n=1 Tax=Notolabrus celidotus TaxID=1203425 RepID=UPI00149035C4|nr:zymogen granule membrane protein 16-like [Notolabrus celidotus]XP_034553809.1 zymogen granule membrane protein 16-like [Notolabrus celidotus]XP_034553810.1 zymogen granule membrane protein 16-like [Notolabrus celidotus]